MKSAISSYKQKQENQESLIQVQHGKIKNPVDFYRMTKRDSRGDLYLFPKGGERK